MNWLHCVSQYSPYIMLELILLITFSLHQSLALHDRNDLTLTSDEKFALDKFKTQVSELLPEDFMKSNYYLIRWLRITDLELPSAQTRLLQTVKWRQRNNISTILSEDWGDMEHDFPISFPGYDKEGRPLMTIEFGDWDITLKGKMPRLQRYLTQAVERNMQNIFKAQGNQKLDKPVSRSVILVDADGFNVRQNACVQCLALLANWSVVSDLYYPNFNDEVIIVNAPPLAVVSLNSIRPVMTPETRNTLKVFNSNKQVWMDYIDKKIDKNNRGLRYGGNL